MGVLVVRLASGEEKHFAESGPVVDERTQQYGWSVPPDEPFIEYEHRTEDDGSLVIWVTRTRPDKYTEIVTEREAARFPAGEWVGVRWK